MSVIKVLSWNICFGCMYSNEKSIMDTTAFKLANTCREINDKKNENVCLINVANFIAKHTYDFICLQEATNWEQIYTICLTKNQNLAYLHHSVPIGETTFRANMVTFYDSSKFEIKYARVSNLAPKIDGRPYQILFFTEYLTQKKIIIINVHCSHSPIYTNTLSENLNMCVDLTNTAIKSYKNINQKQTIDVSEYIIQNCNDFNVIMMGDFNDHRRYYWRGFKPFEKVDNWLPLKSKLRNVILSVLSIERRNQIEPPKTCCVGEKKLRHTKNEDKENVDYVLIDPTKMDFIIQNKIPDDSEFIYNAELYPTSDHIPIISELKIIEVLENKEYKLTTQTPTILKLLPIDIEIINVHVKIHDQYFVGATITHDDLLIFPNGKTNEDTGLVLVANLYNPNKIGYIERKLITENINGLYGLKKLTQNVTLRLQNNISDPNENEILNGKPFKGCNIDAREVLIFPNGQIIRNKFVVIQKKDDSDIFGYIDKNYIESNSLSGGNNNNDYYKYLKYKSKYLEIKKK